MSVIESNWIAGVACDVRSCDVRSLLPELVPAFGDERRSFEQQLLASGWARRFGRSVVWYCPDHAHRAYRCIKARWGMCSPHCPVHNGGRVEPVRAGS